MPSSITAVVAAAWAMIAGWMRIVGQVTAVVTGSCMACDSAPITLPHERALPLLVVPRMEVVVDPQRLEPARSAARACSTSSRGAYSSQDRK